VERGTFALGPDVPGTRAARGVDGRSYSPFGLGQSIFNVPFYIAGRGLQRVLGLRLGKPDTVPRAAVAMSSAVAAAGTVAVTFVLAWRITGDLAGAVMAAALLGFGTVLWPYSKFGFGAPLAAGLLMTAVERAWVAVREGRPVMLLASGAALGGALLTRHELALAAVPIGLWLAWELRGRERPLRQLSRFAAGTLPAGLVAVGYNLARFGQWFDTGYLRDESVGWLGGVPTGGITGLLFSPGASVFIYSPITIVGLVALARLGRRDRSTAALLAALFAMFLLFYGTIEAWSAGRSYGSRYLLPFVPFLCLPLAALPRRGWARWQKAVFSACCVASVVVQVPGVLVDYSKVRVDYARRVGPGGLPDWEYSWEGAGLVLNTRAALNAVPKNVRLLAGLEARPSLRAAAGEADRDFAQQFAFSLDFWWLYLYFLGVWSAPVALVAGLLPLATAAWLAWCVRCRVQRFGI
jgi:hypothetical protein